MLLYNLLESKSCKLIERGSDVLWHFTIVIQNLSWHFGEDFDFFDISLYSPLLQ